MQPRVLGFLCQRGAYMFYATPHSVLRRLPMGFQALPVQHLQQLQFGDVVKAFRFGAEHVLLVGCEACWEKREEVEQHYAHLQRQLLEWGVPAERCRLAWCSSNEPEKFSEIITTAMAGVRQLAPLRLPKSIDEIIVHCG